MPPEPQLLPQSRQASDKSSLDNLLADNPTLHNLILNSPALFGCPPSPSPQGVAEFKVLYFKHYGVELSQQQALEAATHLLHLLYFGLTPLPEDLR